MEQEKLDGRSIRRSLNQTGRYTRQPNNNTESQQLMEVHGVGYSATGLVAQMREQGNVWQQGEVTVKLAKAYGYCWGVERAVRMAYEAKRAFPDKKLYITNEIIHNPEVNNVSPEALWRWAGIWQEVATKGCCKQSMQLIPFCLQLQRLRELDISIVEEDNGKKDYSNIQGGDVVIFPAFGATAQASFNAPKPSLTNKISATVESINISM